MYLAAIAGTLLLLLQPSAGATSLTPAVQAQAEQPQQSPSPIAPSPTAPSEEKSADKSAAPPASDTSSESKPCAGASAADSKTSPDCKAVPPSKTKRKKRKSSRPPESGSGKTVVRNGSTADPTVEISPSVNQQQASRQLEATNQLLSKTEVNLKTIAERQLNPGQQDTVKQIGSYIDQARTAAKGGDVQRAYNLAHKAHLLSVDLLGH